MAKVIEFESRKSELRERIDEILVNEELIKE